MEVIHIGKSCSFLFDFTVMPNSYYLYAHEMLLYCNVIIYFYSSADTKYSRELIFTANTLILLIQIHSFCILYYTIIHVHYFLLILCIHVRMGLFPRIKMQFWVPLAYQVIWLYIFNYNYWYFLGLHLYIHVSPSTSFH